MKLKDLIELFIADVCAGKSNETPGTYRRKLHRLLEYAGNTSAKDLSPETLKRFKMALVTQSEHYRGTHNIVKGHLSVWTVRSVLQTAKHFGHWLFANDYTVVDIAANIKLPKAPPMDPKYVSEHAIAGLIRGAQLTPEPWERARNVAFIYLLRDSGGRVGALLNAQLQDLDLEAGELATVSKGGKRGLLFFNAATKEALQIWVAYRAQLQPRTDQLFVNNHDRRNERLTREGVRWILKRAAKRGGIEGERINPHAFRHAFARDLLRSRQADLSTVSRLMWHSGVTITADYYARWDGAELKRIHSLASPGASLPMPSQPNAAEGNHV